MSSKKVLNTAPPSGDVAISTPELARDLQRLMLSMKGRYMREDGRGVDYAALKQSEEFKEYLVKAGALAGADPGSLDEDQRKCFFISILTAEGDASCTQFIRVAARLTRVAARLIRAMVVYGICI